MVKKYKTVSIVYGGSGRNYATKMKNLIDKLSSEYFTSELDYIDFQEEVGLIDKEESLSEFNRLKTELGDYYNDDEKLEKLSLIQDKINEKIKNKSV